jgi:hypothetical protein
MLTEYSDWRRGKRWNWNRLYLPERDATVSALFLAELVAWHEKTLGELLKSCTRNLANITTAARTWTSARSRKKSPGLVFQWSRDENPLLAGSQSGNHGWNQVVLGNIGWDGPSFRYGKPFAGLRRNFAAADHAQGIASSRPDSGTLAGDSKCIP